ncbi:uncharacterized protein LOC143146807 isoform X4 [Ptiloglossa arizonensis]|uniref:uncharacterized protein LOC143146807 isoform X4 n=1 Tax=Ptiloglossa arizonensis TaxID=3350558 RepID=UPI003F9F0C22
MVGRGSAARRNLSQSIRDSIWTRPVVLQRSRNSHVVSTSCFTTGNSTPPFVASTMIGCDEMENCSCPSRRAEMKKMQPSVDNVKFNENSSCSCQQMAIRSLLFSQVLHYKCIARSNSVLTSTRGPTNFTRYTHYTMYRWFACV